MLLEVTRKFFNDAWESGFAPIGLGKIEAAMVACKKYSLISSISVLSPSRSIGTACCCSVLLFLGNGFFCLLSGVFLFFVELSAFAILLKAEEIAWFM